jgi:hypothetical protein
MRSWRDWSWADGNFWDSGVQPLHERQGVRGHIEISNGGPLGGGEFRIYLP